MSLLVSAGAGASGCHALGLSLGGKVPRRGSRKLPVRAALVEAKPRPHGLVAVQVVGGDRAEDMQAEARAMARAVNASVYSPEVLSRKYGSRPIQVTSLIIGRF